MTGQIEGYSLPASQASANERADFIRRTYQHLCGAIVVFIILEALLVNSPLAPLMFGFIAENQYGFLMILGGFIVVSMMASGFAHRATTPGMQYFGLGLYILLEALIFVPLIYIAINIADKSVLPAAAIMTLVLFGGLTFTAFTSKTDFSFLRGFLFIVGAAALGLIVCAVIFGLSLGVWFSAAMIVFAGGVILFKTGQVLHHFPTDRHVAASLELFAAIALLFWYILRLFLSRD